MNTLSHPGSPPTWLSAICCPGNKGQKEERMPEAHYLILSHSGVLSLHRRATMHWRGKTVTYIPIYFILILKRLHSYDPPRNVCYWKRSECTFADFWIYYKTNSNRILAVSLRYSNLANDNATVPCQGTEEFGPQSRTAINS